jgi:pyruvate dehydrogenase E1 component
MFGFQRTGDLFWAAGDSRARGFLIGATAGRTTLNGEGLQHQDGHSHLAVSAVPTARCYDPAFAFELAVIIEHGLDRFASGHDEFYYITTMNENYPHLAMPIDSREGIIQGGYCLQPAHKPALSLLGSGAILWEVIRAADVLRQKFQLSVEVLSITSFTELRRHALLQERLEPEIPPYVATLLEGNLGPVIAATDYIRLHADQIARWIKRPYYVLGTDGFGRSGSREQLRRHFEVAATDIVATALEALIAQGSYTNGHFKKALSDYHKKKNHPLAL